MFIENISMSDAIKGNHYFEKGKTILIQIQDKGTWQFAIPKYKDEFITIHQFAFDDITEESASSIQEHQAKQIANILDKALEDGHNIVVHCHAGICRSGAVTEVGVMMGFQDTENLRIPNTLVKKLLVDYVDWNKYY